MLNLLTSAADMVTLDHVTKVTPEAEPHLIFGSVTAMLPVTRRLAILGRQGSGKSTLLALLAGTEPVDGGRVRGKIRFSMVLNSKPFLYLGMSGIENAELLARVYAMPPKRFVELAMSLPGVPSDAWLNPIGELAPRARREIEILVAGLLPFDCFLLDDADRVNQNVILTLTKLVRPRGAGLIFTTFAPRFARQYGDCGAVIANRTVAVFDTATDAVAHYG